MTNSASGITRICHLNIRSISDKQSILFNFLITNQISICILSETWLTDKKRFNIPGYNIIRRDRPKSYGRKVGGGLLIAVHHSIRYEKIELSKSPLDIELLVIRLKSITRNEADLNLVAYYNPPDWTVRKEPFEEVASLGQHTLIMGDLNAHSPVWLSSRSNASGRVIEELLEDHDLVLLNDDSATFEPSRRDYKAILDLAICNENLSNEVQAFSTGEFDESDHNPIFVDLLARSAPSFGLMEKIVRKIDWDKFSQEIEKYSPEIASLDIESSHDIDLVSSRITTSILQAIDQATSTKTVRFDPHARLRLPPEIVELIHLKRSVRTDWRRTEDRFYKIQLNWLDAKVKFMIRQHKQNRWASFCEELNSHQVSDSLLWRKLQSIEKSQEPKSRRCPVIKTNNRTTDDPVEVAKVFASSLARVFQDARDENFDEPFRQLVENSANEFFKKNPDSGFQVTVSEISSSLGKLRSRGAPGEDGITNACLKHLPPAFLQALASLFNASINIGYIPQTWKRAVVVMLPKALKDHTDPTNYRPISLLSTLSKLLERAVLFRLQYWMASNSILSPLQCGFRKGRQTADHILRLVQNGYSAFNRNENTGAIFIDIEKAFDRVWHNGLLFKLDRLGIPNYLGIWIRDYLQNRTFRVRVGQSFSNDFPIKAGVPQGSVLGPVLFNLFFNDITDRIANKVELGLFADDLSAWTSFNNNKIIEKRLQTQVDYLEEWMRTWRTQISIKKTVWILFQKGGRIQKNQLSLTYNDQPISMERNPKFLGVTLDPGLRFHKYADSIRERAARRINILRRIRGKNWGASTKLVLTTYNSLVRPIIDYTPFITHLMSETSYMVLERIQRRAARVATYWPIKTNTRVIYESLGLETVRTRAWRLTDNYLKRALSHHDLIRLLVSTYQIAEPLNEGSNIHPGKKPRPTILGLVKNNLELECNRLLSTLAPIQTSTST